MKKLLTVALFVMLIAGTAHGDVLWYSLENGSRADITNEIGVELIGRIGVHGCGEGERNVTDTRTAYPFYAIKLDSTPEELEPHLDVRNNAISLFGGPGVTVSGMASLIAYRDGRVSNFQWYLQQKLDSDYGNEAIILTRLLMLDDKQSSAVTFHNRQQACPDTIRLHLKIVDRRTTYKPEIRNLPETGQATVSTPKGYKDTVLGHVVLLAKAIPDSLEKIDEGGHVHPHLLLKKNFTPQPVPVELLQRPLKPKLKIRRVIKGGESENAHPAVSPPGNPENTVE